MTEKPAPADLFVSAVTDHLCSRMGTVASGRPVWIGCKRVDGKLVWDESEVVRISAREYREHRRTYDGAIRRGELTRRTEKDFKAWTEKLEQQSERDAANAKAKAEAAKQAAESTETKPKSKPSKGTEES